MVQAFGPLTFGLTVAAMSASAGGVWLSIRFARRVGVMDLPNERSSHSTPTPRMGGVPMALSAIAVFGIWTHLLAGEVFPYKGITIAILFASGMFVLGFLDDLFDLSPLVRFVVQFALCAVCLGFAWRLVPGVSWTGTDWGRMFWILPGTVWCVWMLNLYNFMDGIDGLAGGEAALASLYFFLLFAREGESGWAVVNLFVAAAAMGFLVHNWPPARVFMGDAGSAFLGAFYGMQSVLAPLSTNVPFLVLVLPFANFILDTTCTLVRRFLQGEKWYRAHRSHYYQKLTLLGMSHGKVTVLEMLAVLFCCLFAEIYLRVGGAYRVAATGVVLVSFLGAGLWVNGRVRLAE